MKDIKKIALLILSVLLVVGMIITVITATITEMIITTMQMTVRMKITRMLSLKDRQSIPSLLLTVTAHPLQA